MENPRHREALRVLSAQPKRLRTEYVACCIMRVQRGETLEQLIKDAVQKAVRSLPVTVTAPRENGNPQAALSDLPDSLIHAMDDVT